MPNGGGGYYGEEDRIERKAKRMEERVTQLRNIIDRALEIAESGTNDGGHHKMWVIDQMVRALTGCPTIKRKGVNGQGEPYTFDTMGESDEYIEWLKDFQQGEEGPHSYEWDTGVAP